MQLLVISLLFLMFIYMLYMRPNAYFIIFLLSNKLPYRTIRSHIVKSIIFI